MPPRPRDAHKGRNGHVLAIGRKLHLGTSPQAVVERTFDAAAGDIEQANHIAPHGIRHLWADNAYHGDWIAYAHDHMNITIEIVARPTSGKGFQVQPRRWVVERTFAWITRRRRCARDYERLTDHHEAAVHWAAIIQMTRRQARHAYQTSQPSVQKQPL